jgi:hypothetical protein
MVVVGVLLLVMLLTSTFVTSIPAQIGDEEKVSITGNKIYLDSADVYFSAMPHTLKADGYLYLNFTSKTFSGSVDLCLGFDGDSSIPSCIEVYDPYNVTTQHELNLSSYWENPAYNVAFNYTKKAANTVYDGVVYVCLNQSALPFINQTSNQTSVNGTQNMVNQNTLIDADNETSSKVLDSVMLQQHFDFADLDSKMFYWNTTETLYWRSICGNLSNTEQNVKVLDMTAWYFECLPVEEGGQCYLRIWLTFPACQACELLVGFKLHNESLEHSNHERGFSVSNCRV